MRGTVKTPTRRAASASTEGVTNVVSSRSGKTWWVHLATRRTPPSTAAIGSGRAEVALKSALVILFTKSAQPVQLVNGCFFFFAASPDTVQFFNFCLVPKSLVMELSFKS